MPMVLDSTAYKLNVFFVFSIELHALLECLALQRIVGAFPKESCGIAFAEVIFVTLSRP